MLYSQNIDMLEGWQLALLFGWYPDALWTQTDEGAANGG